MYPYLWQATLPQVEAVFHHSVLQSDKADLSAVALSTLSFIAPVLPGSCPPACQEEREQGLRSVLSLLGFFLPSPPGTPSSTPLLLALRVCSLPVCGVGHVATLRDTAASAVAKYQVDGVVGVESGVASLPSELSSLVARKLLMYAPDKATTYRHLQVHVTPCISLFIIYYSFLIFHWFFCAV